MKEIMERNEVVMKLVTVAEMRAIEQEADASGLTYDQMMEHAGRNLARAVLGLPFVSEEGGEALGLVGPGNNGGDTLVALAHLAERGWQANAYLVKRNPQGDDLVERLKKAGGEVVLAAEDADFDALSDFLETADVLLDGLLGTGIRLPLRGEVARVLAATKERLACLAFRPFVVAVDCPSGVDCDSGEAAEECLRADLTVTMAAVKQGLLRLPAFDLIGELRVASIGLETLEKEIESWKAIRREVANEQGVAAILPKRPRDAHKGTFGTALVVAGSVNYTGAALLAGKAAYRIGAGLVTLAVPSPLHAALAGAFPEATWLLLPHELGVIAEDAAEVLLENLERPTAMLIGPGFGLEETTGRFLEKVLQPEPPKRPAGRIGFVHSKDEEEVTPEGVTLPPLVFDADGLKLLARIPDWHKVVPAPAVLTPHPGEMAVLTGLSTAEIQADRFGVAEKFAAEWGHVVVLKGAFTVVAAPDGRTAVIPVATPALARAGTGDVLAGAIVGLRAQGVEAFEAAVAGAWVHARAGEYAAEVLGNSAAVLAGDVLDSLSDVLAELG